MLDRATAPPRASLDAATGPQARDRERPDDPPGIRFLSSAALHGTEASADDRNARRFHDKRLLRKLVAGGRPNRFKPSR